MGSLREWNEKLLDRGIKTEVGELQNGAFRSKQLGLLQGADKVHQVGMGDRCTFW